MQHGALLRAGALHRKLDLWTERELVEDVGRVERGRLVGALEEYPERTRWQSSRLLAEAAAPLCCHHPG